MPSSTAAASRRAAEAGAVAAAAALGTTAELSDKALAVAKTELREDKSTREQALEQFRDWIAKNEDLENCRTGEWSGAGKRAGGGGGGTTQGPQGKGSFVSSS